MNKSYLFDRAMKAGLYKDVAWLICAFSISKHAEEDNKKTPWRIESDITGHYVYDEKLERSQIEDAPADKPVYEFTDLVTIGPGNIPNLSQEIETTYGNWFINYLLLVEPFGTKIAYMDGDITTPMIEKKILVDFRNNVKYPEKEDPKAFYVREYLRYADAKFLLTGLTQLAVWTATAKTLQPASGINAYRDKLVEENKDHIDDLAVIADISKKLGDYDREYMKDDPGTVFLNTNPSKSFDVVRMKKFGTYGAEVGMVDNAVKGTLVKKSLYEGWEIDKFPIMNDASRAGSFNRGFQTQLGGVQVKWILRAMSNISLTADDCGSTYGVKVNVTQENKNKLISYYVVDEPVSKLVKTEEDASAYIGKVVRRRSPQGCLLPGTNLCKACVGSKLSISPEGISLAASEYGSIIMGIFMSMMHGNKLSTAKMDFRKSIT